MLLWFAQFWLVHNHLQDKSRLQDDETTPPHQAVCFQSDKLLRPTIHRSAKPHTSFTSIIGVSFQFTFKITGFLVYSKLASIKEDWSTTNPFATHTAKVFYDTHQGCFPESLSECGFLPHIIISVFPMFTLSPLNSRCFFHKSVCRVVHP